MDSEDSLLLFRDARSKIERSKKHIGDFQGSFRSLQDSYVSSVEKHLESGGHSLKYSSSKCDLFHRELALICGDAIHNLRSALDIAWSEAVRTVDQSLVTKSTKFPIRPTREEVETALNGTGIRKFCAPLINAVIAGIQPYQTGNDTLWALHELDIMDKHKLILPTINYIGVEGLRVEDENGVVHEGSSYPKHGNGPYYIDFPPFYKIQNHGKLILSVIFNEGTPSPFAGMDIIDALTYLPAVVNAALITLGECF
jgi:hypothetical protein